MGFTGIMILARTGRSLEHLTSITSVGNPTDDVLANRSRYGHMDALKIGPDTARAAADEIHAPFMCAIACDSDFAIVWFTSPGSPVTQFYLHPQMAAES